MGAEENDEETIYEAESAFKKFSSDYEAIKVETLLSGEYDSENALVALHSGAGGTEACDWVAMLFRMYSRFAEKMGFKTEILDYLEGEEAGIKSVTVKIAGRNAYGYLKSEKGVHRLVRISPFDASGKRHTSFASCDVMPELNDEVYIKINPDDIRVDTYRSSGAGGQHVNKTDSAIRITHFPTGIVVSCQNERSQRQNKETAMKILRGRIFELKEQERLLKLKELRGEVKEIGWGSQIRSYVFQPYSMVKDHRTNEETGNVGAVMDGSIINFINAYLTWIL
jgi:peptide chain release factor 2